MPRKARKAAHLLTEDERHERSLDVIENWARLVNAFWRVRRLQRYVGYIGSFLQTFDGEFRERLKYYIPSEGDTKNESSWRPYCCSRARPRA